MLQIVEPGEVEQLVRRISSLIDHIHERISRIEEEFRKREVPLEALGRVPRPPTPGERMLSAPVVPPAATLKSRLEELIQAQIAEEERITARQSPSQERASREQIIDEELTRSKGIEVPIDKVVQGIADRGTSNRIGGTTTPSFPFPKASGTIPEKFKFVGIDLGRIEPFRTVSQSIQRLQSLQRTHFAVGQPPPRSSRTGGAPDHLMPVDAFLVLILWPPSASVRRYLTVEFLEKVRGALTAPVKDLNRMLRTWIAEIERFPPVGEGPEAGSSIRA